MEAYLKYSIYNLQYSLLFAPRTGHGFGQNRLDFIQQFAFTTALGKVIPLNAHFAWTLYQIPDFEIVFILEPFYGHFIVTISAAALPAKKGNFYIIEFFAPQVNFALRTDDIQPSWRML